MFLPKKKDDVSFSARKAADERWVVVGTTVAITIVGVCSKTQKCFVCQAQQINFKSVLNCQNAFKCVFNLLGLFVTLSEGH